MRKWIIVVSVTIIFLILVNIILTNALLSPVMFKNNKYFDKQTNDEIKQLVLNAVKDRCLSTYNIDDKTIYNLISGEIIQYESPLEHKTKFCFINRDFMNTLYQPSENTYSVIVHVTYPEELFYDFIISKHNGKFLIDFFQLDA